MNSFGILGRGCNKMCKLQFLKILMINRQQAILSFYFGYRILRISDVNVSVTPYKDNSGHIYNKNISQKDW